MPLHVPATLSPHPHAFAELALIGSISVRRQTPAAIPGFAMRQFWTAGRTLQQRWLKELSLPAMKSLEEPERFERLTLEVLLVELLTRVWATNWTIADRAEGQHDAERILGNSLQGLNRIRREILLLMVRNWRGQHDELVSRLDRFRRRSERWTDLLIAGPAAGHGVWDFAIELSRAQDFGLESWPSTPGATNTASLLVSAGLRVMFGTPFPLGCCRSKPFGELLTAVMASLPVDAYRPDGTLKPAGDWLKTCN